jgi:SAM-dependent methyltransferase
MDMNYIQINKRSWNNRLDAHLNSKFYDLEGFLNGNTSLNEIELRLLGDIKNKTVLHLQCHFGQDTISLGRMGANVTGVDLSDKAIVKAKELASQSGVEATFICSDIYELPKQPDQQFDIVFTTYGAIGWLPDLDEWGAIISAYLKPGGKLILAEFHPVVWMFDDNFEKVGYNYFNSGAILETETGTYADKEASISQDYVNWNHSLSEVVNGLIKNGLEIISLDEYDYSPYNIFKGSVEVEPKKYRIEQFDNKIPMVYSIVARKKN